jgi:hypothetical protein
MGTVSWLFREFKASEAYARRLSARTGPDYERVMQLVDDQVTKRGDRVGDRPVKAITPGAADRLYARIVEGPRRQRLRQDEKAIALCRHAWNVVIACIMTNLIGTCRIRGQALRSSNALWRPSRSDTRAGLYVHMGAIEAGHPGGRRGGGDLLRMAAAP